MQTYQWHLPQRCTALNKGVSRRVPSSSGKGSYSVQIAGDYAACTCPGFKFHGKCKHIAAVQAELCSWYLGTSPTPQTLQQNVQCVCPACGGPTELIPPYTLGPCTTPVSMVQLQAAASNP